MIIQYIDTETVSGRIPLKVSLGDKILVTRKSPLQFPDFQDELLRWRNSRCSNPSVLIVLPDEHVSTYHAVIEFCTEKCTLRDLESSNGTTLNSNACKRLVAYELKQSDVVCIAGQEFFIEIVAPFSDTTSQSEGIGLPTVKGETAQWIEDELKIDRQMWARQGPYLCGTCREKVLPSDKACRNCLQQMNAQNFLLTPHTTIDFGLRLLNLGVRWDRCFFDAVINSSGMPAFVEMQAVHNRDLPERDLEASACDLLHLRHAGLFRLFAWFDVAAPGWKYDKSHVRVYEHLEAVNLAAVARNGPIACSIAAEIVLAATSTALFALENNCWQFADHLDIGQIWLVPSSGGGYGLKLDCHRQNLLSWRESGYAESVRRPLYSAADLITAARGVDHAARIEHSRILNAAIILYRLIAGNLAQFPEVCLDLDPWRDWCIEELPSSMEISAPIADLIYSCLGRDTRRMPINLSEFAERLSSASPVA